jgi:hypothetical protein
LAIGERYHNSGGGKVFEADTLSGVVREVGGCFLPRIKCGHDTNVFSYRVHNVLRESPHIRSATLAEYAFVDPAFGLLGTTKTDDDEWKSIDLTQPPGPFEQAMLARLVFDAFERMLTEKKKTALPVSAAAATTAATDISVTIGEIASQIAAKIEEEKGSSLKYPWKNGLKPVLQDLAQTFNSSIFSFAPSTGPITLNIITSGQLDVNRPTPKIRVSMCVIPTNGIVRGGRFDAKIEKEDIDRNSSNRAHLERAAFKVAVSDAPMAAAAAVIAVKPVATAAAAATLIPAVAVSASSSSSSK